ncbi:transcriptional regulator, AraC family [Micromonospora mirobrigensis]|uniref:Transcriptional regulator, AraC family n=2 Tax=Micromonospora mirobrigensis TaxID=262898 RepID=A0A1C4X2C8_9ACTN|nr:transcriptional regulator, AraC family [Micromonospora mirobrigensis]
MSTILDGHRARGAFVLRCVMAPPWSVRIADRAAVGMLVMVRGHAMLLRDGDDPVRLEAGDVAIVKGPRPYTLADDPGTPPTVVVGPGQHCHTLDGADVSTTLGLGLRTWGNDPDGPCAFLTGTYELPSQVTGRLLAAIPDLVVLPGVDRDAALVRVLADEFTRDAPGQDVVLDRLVDLVLIGTLRAWFARPDSGAPAWWRAQGDQVVGGALRLIHDRPDEPWTLDALAGAVAVSRATLARRFTALVGQPPMAYLTEWRMSLAADLLRDTTASVEAVARQVGYANPFAFSTAFKRHFAAAPRAFRTAGRTSPLPDGTPVAG